MGRLKTIDACNVYNLLDGAKLSNIDGDEKFAVIKILRALRKVSKDYDETLKMTQDKLKGDDHDNMTARAKAWNSKYEGKKRSELSDEQLKELDTINGYFRSYGEQLEKCMKDVAEKEVEMTFTKLTQKTFSSLVSSNDWTCGQILMLEEAVCSE